MIFLFTMLVLWHPLRPRPLASVAFAISYTVSDAAGLALMIVAVSTGFLVVGGQDSVDHVMIGIAVAAVVGLVLVIRRNLAARSIVATSIADDLGVELGQRSILRDVAHVAMPLPIRPLGVARVRNVHYTNAGRRGRLDVYHSHDGKRSPGPILVHFHSGQFQFGGKSRESRAMLFRLAADGWLCISATYRVRGPGRFPNSLVDAKHAIVWAKRNAAVYGGDPRTVVVIGSSAGAHLATMAALTPGVADFQPGFDTADTSVAGVVGLYGYYGPRESSDPQRSSPAGWISNDAPPMMIVHGEADPWLAIADVDAFVAAVRRTSCNPVAYIRLPHVGHSFDLFSSPRYDAIVDAVKLFGEHLQTVREVRRRTTQEEK